MLVVGLTGQSGAGKGLFSSYLRELGLPSLDTDQTARQVVQKGTPCLAELREEFGDRILLPDGSLDRKALAALVFSDKALLQKLNEITHRYILVAVTEWVHIQRSLGARAALLDAPLLFESGANRMCGITVAVVAKQEILLRRIMQRDTLSREQAEKRLAAQQPESFFWDNCDYVICNDGDEKALYAKAAEFFSIILPKEIERLENAGI